MQLSQTKQHIHCGTPISSSRQTWCQEFGKGVQPDDAPLGIQGQIALLQAVKPSHSCRRVCWGVRKVQMTPRVTAMQPCLGVSQAARARAQETAWPCTLHGRHTCGCTCCIWVLQVVVRVVLDDHYAVLTADGVNLPLALHRHCRPCIGRRRRVLGSANTVCAPCGSLWQPDQLRGCLLFGTN